MPKAPNGALESDAVAQVKSGGATFWPRLEPRPAYPPASVMVPRFLTEYILFTLQSALIGVATRPCYTRLAAWFHAWFHATLASRAESHLPSWVRPEDALFALGLSIAINFTYTVVNGFFAICDSHGFLQQYKLPRHPAQEPSRALVSRALTKQAVSHCLTAPILMMLIVGPYLRLVNPAAADPAAVPSFLTLCWQLAACHSINDTWFYWGHRLLHSRAIYAAIHKQHHQFVATRSYAAEHSEISEAVFTAYLPYLAGLLLCGAHFHTVNVWFMCRVVETYEAHSGYAFHGTWADRLHLARPRNAGHHDFHHTGNRGSFGTEFHDWLFGTDDAWHAGGGFEGYRAKKVKGA